MAPVHEAAKENDVEALAALLDAEPGLIHALALLDSDGRENSSPLHFAVHAGSMEAAQLLIDRGADVNMHVEETMEDEGLTPPLMLACLAGRPAMVSLLLARGADPVIYGDKLYRTALAYAIAGKSTEDGTDHAAVIRLLLKDARIAINRQGYNGRTALWNACDCNSLEKVRVLLLEGQADPTIADVEGRRPVDVAKDPAIVRLFKV